MLTNPLYTVLVAMLCISIDAFSTPSRIQKETHISMKSKDNIFRIPAIIGTAIALMSPLDVNAVPSGSRSGGSSFRSAPSFRSSTSLRSSMPTRSYSSGPSINIMPSYGYGYGFGGFGMSPFSPFSYIPINFNVVLLAGTLFFNIFFCIMGFICDIFKFFVHQESLTLCILWCPVGLVRIKMQLDHTMPNLFNVFTICRNGRRELKFFF